MPNFEIVSIEQIKAAPRVSEARRKKLEEYVGYINQLTNVKGGRLVCSADDNISAVRNDLRRAAEIAGKKIAMRRAGNIISFFLEKRSGVADDTENITLPKDAHILDLAENYYKKHKESLLAEYKGKYIAILDNKVVGADKDFSTLARKVYAKYGYQTIYMPYVDVKERIVRVPSPRIKT